MQKWAVFICPYTLKVYRAESWDTCLYNYNLFGGDNTAYYKTTTVITTSGEFHVLVEAETELEAMFKGLQKVAIEKMEDIKQSREFEKKQLDACENKCNNLMEENNNVTELFTEIIREGELTIYSTGRRVMWEKYLDKKIKGEFIIGDGFSLFELLKGIKESESSHCGCY